MLLIITASLSVYQRIIEVGLGTRVLCATHFSKYSRQTRSSPPAHRVGSDGRNDTSKNIQTFINDYYSF